MESEFPKQGSPTVKANAPSEFATLHHLVSRVDSENRMQDVVKKAHGLQPQDAQLLVDCLSMALDKNAAPLKNRLYIWRSLIKVASSAKLFAQSHTLRAGQFVPDSSPDVYRISEESSVRVKVLKRAQNDIHQLYSEPYMSWAHLSHPNVIPLYPVFFEGNKHPFLVSPYMITNKYICDYAREHPKIPHIPLISDIVNGLFYIHQFDIVHGGLNPQSILVSDDGRALITDLNTTPESRDSPARYLAPEILEDDDIRPTKATDMWSFACISYEVLSGKLPFYQFAQERKLVIAVAKGAKPIRPEGDGHDENKIDDTIWQLLLLCWELEPTNRPLCLKVHQMLVGMGLLDVHSVAKSMIGPDTLLGSTVDLSRARVHLTGVLRSDHASSLRVPEHIRSSLLRLIRDTTKLEEFVSAVKKLSPDDAQCFVDCLDLLLEDLPDWSGSKRWATRALLSTIMMSIRIIPQRYILNGVQYDAQVAIVEGGFGKAYEGRGLSVRINAVTNFSAVRRILRSLPNWSYLSHPNCIPFYGLFQDNASGSPRLCVATPLWKNGNLRNYAPTLPQKSRLVLIYDTVKGLSYLHEMSLCYGMRPITLELVLISDGGHAILVHSGTDPLFTEFGATLSTYEHRFAAPNLHDQVQDDIWAFGCLCYEVLSRKLPYYQYTETAQILSAVSSGEHLRRPESTDIDVDEIDDPAWDLIMSCCTPSRWKRPSAPKIQRLIASWGVEDNRPEAVCLPETEILALRTRPDVNFPRVESLLDKIQVELLRNPLSKLVHSRIKDVMAAALELRANDTRTLVDFLDLALKDHLTISEERNRVLALLSRVTSSTCIFPQRYEVKGIKYRPTPIAEGGFGTVHEGLELNMCVKVMARVDPTALTEWIKELILWAHSSHLNVLPFYGVFLESVGNFQRICLVSPFMKNGNLHDFAPRLSQKSRLPLIQDTINGLQYIHGLGIVHSDLKGQNVLISNEGRGLITDFGASHIVTATAAATGTSVYSTLRFSAPEVILGGVNWRPTRESDIWSFGCLCYQVLSRRVPYHEYKLDLQVSAALARKEPPKRPGSTGRNDNDDEWDDDYFDEDWDAIDGQAWNLITKCCAPEPEDRLSVPTIQELIADMKVWDERPPMKAVPGAEIFKLRLNPEIDLLRAGELLDILQEKVAPSEVGPRHSFIQLFNNLK